MNNCSCIRKGSFHFNISLVDCETLMFTDLSDWMDGDHYIIPDVYPVAVMLPNGSKKELLFKPLHTTELKFNVIDGIYCFSVESCGFTYTKSEALLCSIQCKFDTLLANLDLNEDELKRVNHIRTLIEAIKINAKLGNVKQAESFFKIVSKELQKVDCL